MALSNILREPRREITETVIGVAAFILFGFGDFQFAFWFERVTASSGSDSGCPWPLGLLLGPMFFVSAIFLAFAAHALGDFLCDLLAKRGFDPRPKQRFR